MQVICVKREPKYFCQEGWTGRNSLNCFNKSSCARGYRRAFNRSEWGNQRNLTVFSAGDILCRPGPLSLFGVLMEWSTKPRRPDQPFGSWADDLAAAFVRLEPRRIADQSFAGAISRVDAAPIKISRVTATRHTVLRLASHIALSTDDLCFVNLQLEGLGRTTQRGREQICAPGDLAVADTTEPFEIANCRNFKLFCFAVPRRLLPKGLLERPRLNLSKTETGRALSRTLAGYAELCLSDDRLRKTSALVGAHVDRSDFACAGNPRRYSRGARAHARAAVDDA